MTVAQVRPGGNWPSVEGGGTGEASTCVGRHEVSVAIAFRAAKVLDASIYDVIAGRAVPGHVPELRQGAERALEVRWRGGD